MKYKVVLQNVSHSDNIPNQFLIKRWVDETLKDKHDSCEVCIRIVNPQESAELNENYRHKTGPTNVLSFPFDAPEEITLEQPILGDLVICAAVVEEEAKKQTKSLEAHWAHIVIHGLLHLLGYDHIKESDANVMESLEVDILHQLGHPNPYGETVPQ